MSLAVPFAIQKVEGPSTSATLSNQATALRAISLPGADTAKPAPTNGMSARSRRRIPDLVMEPKWNLDLRRIRRTLHILACSTPIELRLKMLHLRRVSAKSCEAVKADDGSRTRDLRLGKPTKYLLSLCFWRICGIHTTPVAASLAELGTRVEHDARTCTVPDLRTLEPKVPAPAYPGSRRR